MAKRGKRSSTKRMKRNNKPSTVVIDPEGDLTLTVGDEAVAFIVCPKTVARASSVWKNMLYGGFAESIQPDKDSSEEWIVRLPDDNPGSMKILLDIIHSRFDRVPTSVHFDNTRSDRRSITFKDLFLLTVLTDKYDLTRNIRPWARKWLSDIDTSGPLAVNFKGFEATDMDRICWITWELGNEETFTNAIRKITLEFVKVEGQLKQELGGPELFSLGYEPANVSSLVDSYREETVGKMLKLLTDVIEKLLQRNKSGNTSLCAYKGDIYYMTEGADCEITMLGAIIKSLSDSGLWPIPNPTELQMSVLDLASKLRHLDTKSRRYDHSCKALPNIEATIEALTTRESILLPEAYALHIKAQAEKTGLVQSCEDDDEDIGLQQEIQLST